MFADEQPEVEEQEETSATPKDPAEEPAEASLDEILAKRTEGDADASEEESLLTVEREEERGVETLAVKVVPQQPTEFVCKKCFLVKHRSQLADKKRMICRDCA